MGNSRSTAQWKELDANSHLHPFTDFNDYQKNHGRIIERADRLFSFIFMRQEGHTPKEYF